MLCWQHQNRRREMVLKASRKHSGTTQEENVTEQEQEQEAWIKKMKKRKHTTGGQNKTDLERKQKIEYD